MCLPVGPTWNVMVDVSDLSIGEMRDDFLSIDIVDRLMVVFFIRGVIEWAKWTFELVVDPSSRVFTASLYVEVVGRRVIPSIRSVL